MTNSTFRTTEEWLRVEARTQGFDAIGITRPEAADRLPARLKAFLAAGLQGDMAWLAERAVERGHPRNLWPATASIIMLGMNYGPEFSPIPGDPASANISVYARGRDYHDVVKKRLKRLARALIAKAGGDVKVFVDTAPVMEKPLAAAAGLGWQGKHSNLVSRDHGSWLFLGAIFTTLQLIPDPPQRDLCGGCHRCLDACPTNAFLAPYRLDPRRCLSYLNIEYKGHIPREFRIAMGNRVYGCDDCLSVCPWNKFASRAKEAAFHARTELDNPALGDLLALDDAGFRALMAGSPIKRLGRDRFIRNLLIAAGNSGDQALLATIEALLRDPSPLVRAMAVWAFRRLSPDFTALRDHHLANETDSAVREEWLNP